MLPAASAITDCSTGITQDQVTAESTQSAAIHGGLGAKARPTANSALATEPNISILYHDLPLDRPLAHTVDVVAAGRRNNPPEEGVPALCAYNPLHYMELPELFMEFISSMTGKSPSTTGAGSEGALTKSPFNALPPVYDLNASLLSYALGGYDGWLSSAGFIGPRVRVAHDISLLVPEVFSRMTEAERDARALIAGGYLERLEDMEEEPPAERQSLPKIS